MPKSPAAGVELQPWMPPSHPETPDAPAFDMSITVGHNAAVELGLSRADVDQWAIYSHGRAIESIDSGGFASQVVPVEIEGSGGKVRLFETDEHPRRGLTLEGMAELKVLHPEIDGFTVTAGNAAGINDAAAAVMLADADYAASNGIEPLAAIGSWAAVGVAPRRTGLAPIDAIPKALARARVDQSDIDLFKSTRPSAPFPSPPRARSGSTRRSATSTAAAAAWGTRSPPLERAWSSPWSTSSGDEARAWAASPCARGRHGHGHGDRGTLTVPHQKSVRRFRPQQEQGGAGRRNPAEDSGARCQVIFAMFELGIAPTFAGRTPT